MSRSVNRVGLGMKQNPQISLLTQEKRHHWDTFVSCQPDANLYHLSGWQDVIVKTYGHSTYYLIAESEEPTVDDLQSSVIGILPLVHMKSWVFGNILVSVPFFDMGGILAADDNTAKNLIDKAVSLGRQLNVQSIELRQTHLLPLAGSEAGLLGWQRLKRENIAIFDKTQNPNRIMQPSTNKVRMLLDLPDSSEELMKSFKAKLRSQIKKPIKEGLQTRIGGEELIDDFYRVFSINMRDLGSPVHSKRLISETLSAFPRTSRIFTIHRGGQTLAASIVVGFGVVLENPWSSSLREFSRLSPNMLLYWKMLEYGCDNGYRIFDFGRSSPDEGTYKFKKQWGAKSFPLHWRVIPMGGKSRAYKTADKTNFIKAIHLWQKLPVPVSRIIGPMIRKHIAL
jgi:FemAB-related protein (PEP-CTERM system-associated)